MNAFERRHAASCQYRAPWCPAVEMCGTVCERPTKKWQREHEDLGPMTLGEILGDMVEDMMDRQRGDSHGQN